MKKNNRIVKNSTMPISGKDNSKQFIGVNKENKTGCLGGLMFFIFVFCAGTILAVLAWMAASDVLALNKRSFTADIVLPASIFTERKENIYDDDGDLLGQKTVSTADIEYISNTLKNTGLIEYKWLFELFCKISNAAEKVDPGEYELKSSYDYRALIKHMQTGAGSLLTVTVTIPEGYTMLDIFEKLDENGVSSVDSLLEAASEASYGYDFIKGDAVGDPTRLEGYLFPDTYEFYVGMEASSAINKLLENFYFKQNADMLKQAENIGYTMPDIIKIASLIEKEAANDSERAIIASVIYNRLALGMSLGIDAAILYVHQDHEGQPTLSMLEEDSPYNLRIKTGLPPTPICNPGLASINAALYPERTNYLYYALDTATGEHRFFTNQGEFDSFVATQDY